MLFPVTGALRGVLSVSLFQLLHILSKQPSTRRLPASGDTENNRPLIILAHVNFLLQEINQHGLLVRLLVRHVVASISYRLME